MFQQLKQRLRNSSSSSSPTTTTTILDADGNSIKLTSEWTILNGTTMEFVSGPPVTFGPLTYQAVVAPVASPQDVTAVLSALRRNEPWNCAITPFAYRFDEPNVIEAGDNNPSADHAVAVAFREGCRDSDSEREREAASSSAGPARNQTSTNNSNNININTTGSLHGDDFGAGEKILNLLRTLDVSNVLVVAARWSRKSFSGSGLVSPARFSALAAATQAGLQRCFDRCAFERGQPPLRLPPRADRLPLRRRQSRLEVQANNNNNNNNGHDDDGGGSNNGMHSAAVTAARRDFEAAKLRAKQLAGHSVAEAPSSNGGDPQDRTQRRTRPQKQTRSGAGFDSKGGPHGGGITAARLLRAHSSAKTKTKSQQRPTAATVSVSSFDPQIHHRFGEGEGGVESGGSMAGEGNFAAAAAAAGAAHKTGSRQFPQRPMFVEAEVKDRFVPLLDVEGPKFSRRAVHQLCAFKTPPQSLFQVMSCIANLKGHPCGSWTDILDMLHRDQGRYFLAPLDLRRVDQRAVAATRTFLLDQAYTPDEIRRHSKFGIVGYDFLVHVISVVDFVRTGRPPPGSIWLDKDSLPKVPLDIKMLVMDENAAEYSATR